MKKLTGILLVMVALAALGSAVAVQSRSDTTWLGAGDSVNMSINADARQVSLALGANEIAMAWAGDPEPGNTAGMGIFLKRWSRSGTPTSGGATQVVSGTDAWYPTLVYSSSQLLASWVQGYYTGPVGSIMQQDIGGGAPLVVMAQVYGYTAPRLAAGPTGYHIVFSAALTDSMKTKGDLYYAYRAPGSNVWEVPSIIVTRTQVIPDDSSGGIYYPSMALSPDGQHIHIAWEQMGVRVVSETVFTSFTVWYVEGSWNGSRFVWGLPGQISPVGQQVGRPNLAVSSDGQVHMTWTEMIVGAGGTTNPEGQYINYARRSTQGVWSTPVRIDPDPVRVNTYRPGRAASSVALTPGNKVCVAWHGFRGQAGDAGQEEILVGCSFNGGVSWEPVFNASETETLSFFPSLQMDPAGQLFLAWEDFQGSSTYTTDYDIFYRSGNSIYKVYLPALYKRGS